MQRWAFGMLLFVNQVFVYQVAAHELLVKLDDIQRNCKFANYNSCDSHAGFLMTQPTVCF